jgi:hypothetical protein
LVPPPNKLVAVAEEVEVENGGSSQPRRMKMREREQIYTIEHRVTVDWACHLFTHIFV